MLLNPFRYHSPSSAAEAAALYARLPEARFLAGGTFLINQLKVMKAKGLKTPQHIVSLRRANDLKGISAGPNRLTIGAMTTMREVLELAVVAQRLPVLADAARCIGTTPIRSMATIGGNITCRYVWAELGAVMLALDAELRFLDGAGREQAVSVGDFFSNSARTDHLLKQVAIPLPDNLVASYVRVAKTRPLDLPLLAICVAACRQGGGLSRVRVIVNSGTAFPQRDRQLEGFLEAEPLDERSPEEALRHLTASLYECPDDDYKQHMFYVSIKAAISEIMR